LSSRLTLQGDAFSIFITGLSNRWLKKERQHRKVGAHQRRV